MFQAAKSIVSTASKSFPDLVSFWTNKEDKQPGHERPTWLQDLRNKDRRYVPLGTQLEKNKTTSTGVSHEEETTQDHNESAFYSDTGQLKVREHVVQHMIFCYFSHSDVSILIYIYTNNVLCL